MSCWSGDLKNPKTHSMCVSTSSPHRPCLWVCRLLSPGYFNCHQKFCLYLLKSFLSLHTEVTERLGINQGCRDPKWPQWLIYPFVFSSMLLCSQGWPWTHDPSASASWVLGLHVCFTMPDFQVKPIIIALLWKSGSIPRDVQPEESGGQGGAQKQSFLDCIKLMLKCIVFNNGFRCSLK